MADHNELVSEMTLLEQMGTQERQKLARKRRSQQIKKWSQREKEWLAKERQISKKLDSNGLNLKNYTTYSSNHRNNLNDGSANGKVHFDNGVMLLEAAARNDIDEVRRLLTLGVSPDSTNHDGLTALHQCCVDAFEPMMKLLIEFGADVNAKDSEQWTPLHAACTCNHPNIVIYLVNSGADLLAVNGDGNMPFDICEDETTLDHIESEMVKRKITQEIIDYTRASTEIKMMKDLQTYIADDGDVNAKETDGITQLHIAAANGYTSVVKYLIDNGADVDVRDTDHWTPLHGAACWGHIQHAKVIELLVQAGADINAKTLNGEAPLDICDNPEIRERLIQLKDEIETKHASTISNLRRTQSRTNSRTHSVRRTSIREKSQISRREAREEALLRQETNPSQSHSDEDSNAVGEDNLCAKHVIAVNGVKKENSNSAQLTKDENQNLSSITDVNSSSDILNISANTNNPSERDIDIIDGKTANNLTTFVISSIDEKNTQQMQSSTNQISPQSSLVFASINCTLSDLKKQRSDLRHRSMNMPLSLSETDTDQKLGKGDLSQLPNQQSSDMLVDESVDKLDHQQGMIGLSQNTEKSITSSPAVDNSLVVGSDIDNKNYINSNKIYSEESNARPIKDGLKMCSHTNGLTKRDLPPPSPSQALQKFRGDPSEVVGGKERYRAHRCCILL